MKLISACCALATILCAAGCATGTPSTLTLKDTHNRHQNNEVAMSDAGTARRCADNMLNASPADAATEVVTQVTGTGKNIVVDVGATLNNVGMFNQSMRVTFRCTYVNGLMVHGTWTSGLKGG